MGVGGGAARSRCRGRSGSGNGSSNGSGTGGGAGGRPTPRRAVSLDVPARPETVAEADEAEEGADANVLGLELGQVRPAPTDVRTAPVGGARNRRLNRHRVMASEGMALLERGR